ncbi:MAG: NAD(P)-binding protein, partial [Deltaproteobacteria bacterium]|nr:NAD(P)-binding protein [Deltaproteobacteria bacterium]
MAKVILAGGGLSGLSLAWFLKRLKPGWDILVLESEARAGG